MDLNPICKSSKDSNAVFDDVVNDVLTVHVEDYNHQSKCYITILFNHFCDIVTVFSEECDNLVRIVVEIVVEGYSNIVTVFLSQVNQSIKKLLSNNKAVLSNQILDQALSFFLGQELHQTICQILNELLHHTIQLSPSLIVGHKLNSMNQYVHIVRKGLKNLNKVICDNTAVTEDSMQLINGCIVQVNSCGMQVNQLGMQLGKCIHNGNQIIVYNVTGGDNIVQSQLSLCDCSLQSVEVCLNLSGLSHQLIIHSLKLFDLSHDDCLCSEVLLVCMILILNLKCLQLLCQLIQLSIQLGLCLGQVLVQPLLSLICLSAQLVDLCVQQRGVLVYDCLALFGQTTIVDTIIFKVDLDINILLNVRQNDNACGSGTDQYHSLVLLEPSDSVFNLIQNELLEFNVGLLQSVLNSGTVFSNNCLNCLHASLCGSADSSQLISRNVGQLLNAVDDSVNTDLNLLCGVLQDIHSRLDLLHSDLSLVVYILEILDDGGNSLNDVGNGLCDILTVNLTKGKCVNILKSVVQNKSCLVNDLQISVELIDCSPNICQSRLGLCDLCLDLCNSSLNSSNAQQIGLDLIGQSLNRSIQLCDSCFGFCNSSFQLGNNSVSVVFDAGTAQAVGSNAGLVDFCKSCLQNLKLLCQSIALSDHRVQRDLLLVDQLIQLLVQQLGLYIQFCVQILQIIIQILNNSSQVLIQNGQNLITEIHDVIVRLTSGGESDQILDGLVFSQSIIDDLNHLDLLLKSQIGITKQHVVYVHCEIHRIDLFLGSTHQVAKDDSANGSVLLVSVIAPDLGCSQFSDNLLSNLKIGHNGVKGHTLVIIFTAATDTGDHTAQIGNDAGFTIFTLCSLNLFEFLQGIVYLFEDLDLLVGRKSRKGLRYYFSYLIGNFLHSNLGILAGIGVNNVFHCNLHDLNDLLGSNDSITLCVRNNESLNEIFKSTDLGIILCHIACNEFVVNGEDDVEFLERVKLFIVKIAADLIPVKREGKSSYAAVPVEQNIIDTINYCVDVDLSKIAATLKYGIEDTINNCQSLCIGQIFLLGKCDVKALYKLICRIVLSRNITILLKNSTDCTDNRQTNLLVIGGINQRTVDIIGNFSHLVIRYGSIRQDCTVYCQNNIERLIICNQFLVV